MNGIDCVFYRNSGTYGSPTWTEVDDILDLDADPSWGEGDASSRGSPVMMTEPTQMALSITGKIRVSLDDADFVALDDAFVARTALDLMVLNGPSSTNGVRGWRMDFKIFGWKETQAANGVLYRDFTMKPCLSSNPPKRAVVASGAAVFTTIA